MECNFSIIVCCYNSSKRLPKTLEAISLLKLNDNFKIEIIVVDNASIDDTFEIAKKLLFEYCQDIDYKVVCEKSLGLSNARKRGVKESKYEYVLFCDDDNWLDFNYLLQANEILTNDPSIGMLGGFGIEVTEINPPSWFNYWKGVYALGKQSSVENDITKKKGYVYGAGAIVQKELLQIIYETGFQNVLKDRTGRKKILGGGDNEIGYVIVVLGYKIYYSSKLVFKHFIPKERLTEKYIYKLFIGQVYTFRAVNTYENYIFRNNLEYRSLNIKNDFFKELKLLIKLQFRFITRKINFFNYKLKLLVTLNKINYFLFYKNSDIEIYKSVKKNIQILESYKVHHAKSIENLE